jgi:hypothetical protein
LPPFLFVALKPVLGVLDQPPAKLKPSRRQHKDAL